MSEVERAAKALAYLAGTKVCVRAHSAKIGGRDWFVAGKLWAIVLCFKRKVSLHSSRREEEGGGWRRCCEMICKDFQCTADPLQMQISLPALNFHILCTVDVD